MLEETYFKFKKNILLKMKKMQPNFQEPVIEYCEPDQVIDICSYNHYLLLDKSNDRQVQHNDDNDIYDTSELKHEFKYGIYEDVFKTEQLMAELKSIDEAEHKSKKLRDLEFKDFPLEHFVDAGRVANEGDPHLKAAADTELHDLEKRAIQIDIDKKNTKIPVMTLMMIPAQVLKTIQIVPKLVTCNHKLSAINTMLNMMKIHCIKQYTDQPMYHTMKTARESCCRKLQICLIKTI